jgi:hypothetical protein
MSTSYRTGVAYWCPGDIWTNYLPTAPVTQWHRDYVESRRVAAQLATLGYNVELVTR